MVLYIVILTAFILLLISAAGLAFSSRNVITILISFELSLLAINLGFIATSVYLDDLYGQIYVLYVLTLAAAESAIGLALIVLYHRMVGVVLLEKLNNLKG